MARIIIEAAINGAVAKKSLNPNIAYSPDEIAADAIATCEAGAALVHFHARDPETGKFEFKHGDLYTQAYRRVRAKSKVMFWPGADIMAMRKGDPDNPDLLFCDPGSVNLVGYDPATRRITNEASVYRVPFEVARHQLEKIRELGMQATVQMFDASYARATLLFLEQGLLTEPLMIKFYFGGPELPFGLPLNAKSLDAYLEMFKGVRINWFAATLGGDNLPNIPLIVSMGGHVRIGLEDHHYADQGMLTNPQIAARAAATIRAMGHQVATPEQAREMLHI